MPNDEENEIVRKPRLTPRVVSGLNHIIELAELSLLQNQKLYSIEYKKDRQAAIRYLKKLEEYWQAKQLENDE